MLRAVSSANPQGLSTAAIVRATGLTRATTHRLLVALTDEGLVDRDQATGRWHLGPELFLMGTAAAGRYDIAGIAQDLLVDLAERTEESAYLSAARGLETVCLLEVEGSFPLRSHVLHEGIRFPLGVASAGLAILAHLPEAAADAYIASSALTHHWGRTHSRRALHQRVSATRVTGYAVNPGLVVEGSWGIGAAVFDYNCRPRWALSLTGVESRFDARRTARLGRLLLQSAHLLTQRMQQSGRP